MRSRAKTHRWARLVAAALLTVVAVLVAGGTVSGVDARAATDARASLTPTTHGLGSLPLPAQGRISALVGRNDRAYHVRGGAGALLAENPAQGVSARFTQAGVSVRAGAGELTLSLARWGYADARLRPVSSASPVARQNRVEYRRGPLREWYVNGPLGVEQGFTLSSPPPGRRAGRLTVALRLRGDYEPALSASARALVLSRDTGPSLHYRGLVAFDADGRRLPARLYIQGRLLHLRVDDAGADYPVTIDPFLERAKLTPSDGAAGDSFGASVAIAGDTIVVGAPLDDAGANNTDWGSAYVFVRPSGGWAGGFQSAKLTGSDGSAGDRFGWSVAIADNTIVVGAPRDDVGANADEGSAYVFVRPAGGWAGNLQQQAKLSRSDEAAGDFFGDSVAVSGNTIVVGAEFANPGGTFNQGSAYVFVEPAFGWSGSVMQQAKLTASDGGADELFGNSVAIGGNTIVVGADHDNVGSNADRGSAYVFVKPASGWAGSLTQQAKLAPSEGAAGDLFGSSVAIAGDAIGVGASGDNIGVNVDQGSAYVLTSGTTWAANNSADFDGDRITDFGLYRGLSPADSLWHAPATGGGTAFQIYFGATSDIPVPGDYDGDGKTDAVIYRPSTGLWYGPRTGAAEIVIQMTLGVPGDIPIPGDYNGDGRTDPAIYRPSSGLFFATNAAGSQVLLSKSFGGPGDVPVPRDYDGDGTTDPGIYRQDVTPAHDSLWYALLSGGGVHQIYFGSPGDVPVPADYNGDGKADSAIFRPSTGLWYGTQSGGAAIVIQMTLGQSGDVAIPGYYDSNLAVDPGIYRPSSGLWFSVLSGGGTRSIAGMGQPSDVPVQKRPALPGGV